MDLDGILLGSLIGTVWWLLFIWKLQPYIIQKEINALASGTSRYQEAIPLLTSQVFQSFVQQLKDDPENKKIITGIIHGYGKSLADQAVQMLFSDQNISKLKQKGQQMGIPGAGINPDAIIGKLLDKFLG